MKTVWKFPIPDVYNQIVVAMPTGARILSVAVQNGGPVLWACVDTTEPMFARSFAVVPTGGEVPSEACFVGTFFRGPFVFHLFDLG